MCSGNGSEVRVGIVAYGDLLGQNLVQPFRVTGLFLRNGSIQLDQDYFTFTFIAWTKFVKYWTGRNDSLGVNGCHSTVMCKSEMENGRRMEEIKDFMVLY